jgi:hypothetical protein
MSTTRYLDQPTVDRVSDSGLRGSRRPNRPRTTLDAFRNVVFWFLALLVILVAGFWNSYFSVIFQPMHATHHFHGIAMLAWVLLLITQAALVRSRRLDVHRKTGRISYVLAPLVVVSGVAVNLHFVARVPEPLNAQVLSLHWFGYFLAGLFAILYVLAMIHRREFALHARYMIATALVFLVPGLSRAFFNIVEPAGLPSLGFYETQIFVGVLGIGCVAWDWMKGQIRAPFVVFSLAWCLNLLVWHLIPHWEAWRTFTMWTASLGV